MNKRIGFRLCVGAFSFVVMVVSAFLAYGFAHSPDEGSTPTEVRAGRLLLWTLCEAASTVAVAAFLGVIWAMFTPSWLSKTFIAVKRHFKYAMWGFYAVLIGIAIYEGIIRPIHEILRK